MLIKTRMQSSYMCFSCFSHLTEEVKEDYVELITEFAHIGGFNAHQKELKRLEAFTNDKQRMMELVYRAWDNISWKVMDKSWACFFKKIRVLPSILV